MPPASLPGPETASRTGGAGTEPRRAADGYDKIRTDEQKKIIDRVGERINYQSRDSSRWALERQYFESVAFYLGIQWIEYTESARRFVRWQAPSWFPTPITNAIKPRVNGMVSRLLRSKPQGRVRPNTNDVKDRMAAKVAEQMVPHIYAESREMENRQFAAYYAALTGTVIAEEAWNPRAGKQFEVPQMQMSETPVMEPGAMCANCGPQGGLEEVGGSCPGCGELVHEGSVPRNLPDGSPAMDVQSVPVLGENGQPAVDLVSDGAITTRMLMLFNFYWDQKAKFLRDAMWCGEASYCDVDWIDRNFPEFGPYVESESGVDAANFYESSLLALVGASVQGSAHYGGHQHFQHGAVVRRYQEQASREFPRGLHVIVANGVELYRGDLPIKDENGVPTGDFSYTEFRYDIVPGRFAGTTPAEDMVPLQRRINGIDAQIILNRKTMLNPWILAPKGSGLNPGQTHMRPGATVLYNFVGVGAAPQVVPGTPLPAQVYVEREACFTAMNELAEDPRAVGAQAPQQTKSGVALHWVKEQMDEFGVARLERWADWHSERDRKRLLLAQQHYREDRPIRIMGESGQWMIQSWSGADLAGNTDITVDPGTLVPRSRSAHTQTVFDAIEAGIIDIMNPVDRQKVLEELNLTRFESDIGPDRRRAQMENSQLDQGIAPMMVNPEDNDDIHNLEHIMQMKDPGFLSKPPEVQMAYRLHVAGHHEQKAMKVQATMAAAAAPAGDEPRGETPIGQGEPAVMPGGQDPEGQTLQ